MDNKIEIWEQKRGAEFLRRIGISLGQTVLDFGCRVGHYTIPTARVVGEKGTVYAVDKEKHVLTELKCKSEAYGLTNIKILRTSGQTELAFQNETIDAALLYDVLHYFRKDERAKLYNEAFRILKKDGLLSVYPKHTLGDDPIQEFRRLTLIDVKREIEDSNFTFEHKHCGLISHDDRLNKGCVFNFRKTKK